MKGKGITEAASRPVLIEKVGLLPIDFRVSFISLDDELKVRQLALTITGPQGERSFAIDGNDLPEEALLALEQFAELVLMNSDLIGE